MSVLQELACADPALPLWYISGRWLTAGEVVAAVGAADEAVADFAGRQVAVAAGTNAELAWILTVLDGLAGAIVLLPPEQDAEVLDGFCSRAGCDRLTGSRGQAISGPPLCGFPDLMEIISRGQTVNGGRAGLRTVRTKWIIPTSGTTAEPKLVAHDFDSLSRTTARDRRKGAEVRWGLLYQIHRFAGLQVFLQSVCGGSGMIVTEPDDAIAVRLKTLAAGGCNALSATPSMWRKLLMLPEVDGLDLRWVTLGGEIADQPVLNTLRKRFPKARITHVYASTEAGVGFSVRDGLEGFPASYLRTPPSGVELRVHEGRLFLRSAGTSQTYVGREDALADADNWIDTGDQVSLGGNGRYIFIGRASGAINVGGSKVQPAEVERVILDVEGVRMASVYGRRNSMMGNLVEAVVVADPAIDRKEIMEKIRARCAEALQPFQRPAVIKFADSLDLNVSGKIERS